MKNLMALLCVQIASVASYWPQSRLNSRLEGE